jgi:hypothetical protein
MAITRRYGIPVTHAYLNWNDKRYDHNDSVNPQDFNLPVWHRRGVNAAAMAKLVGKHAFVMTATVLGDGDLLAASRQGNICHQMMSNYQFRAGRGAHAPPRVREDAKTVKAHASPSTTHSGRARSNVLLDVPVNRR